MEWFLRCKHGGSQGIRQGSMCCLTDLGILHADSMFSIPLQHEATESSCHLCNYSSSSQLSLPHFDSMHPTPLVRGIALATHAVAFIALGHVPQTLQGLEKTRKQGGISTEPICYLTLKEAADSTYVFRPLSCCLVCARRPYPLPR
jgi:hypothetical protein